MPFGAICMPLCGAEVWVFGGRITLLDAMGVAPGAWGMYVGVGGL